ncbi:MAG: hypothetical protein CMJ76_06360 [Planctomycetaceae bacterium]|nr:hypothetical protein [Planctomycetaceae bacterium]|tara:strand:- start:4013 stop:4387 length:375 start_codon:yes stop_codon:yes gene_type:complete
MQKHRSFRPSDFGFSDFPYVLTGLAITSLMLFGFSAFLHTFSSFWQGIVLGVGIGISIPLLFLKRSGDVDISKLQEPSASVQKMCHKKTHTLAEAAKLYSDETGLGIAESKAAINKYNSGNWKE